MIEGRWQPPRSAVTGIARRRSCYVVAAFAGRLGPVMAACAGAWHHALVPERRRLPGNGRMAAIAGGARRHVPGHLTGRH